MLISMLLKTCVCWSRDLAGWIHWRYQLCILIIKRFQSIADHNDVTVILLNLAKTDGFMTCHIFKLLRLLLSFLFPQICLKLLFKLLYWRYENINSYILFYYFFRELRPKIPRLSGRPFTPICFYRSKKYSSLIKSLSCYSFKLA